MTDEELIAVLRKFADYRATDDEMSRTMFAAADRLEALTKNVSITIEMVERAHLAANIKANNHTYVTTESVRAALEAALSSQVLDKPADVVDKLSGPS